MGGFNQGIGNLETGFMRAPLIRQQMALYQARAGEQAAATQEAQQRALLAAAQAQTLKTGDDRIDRLQDATRTLTQAALAYRQNQTPQTKTAFDAAQAEFNSAGAGAKNVKLGDLWTGLGRGFSMNDALNGNPNANMDAVLQGQAASVANNQADNTEKASRPFAGPNGSTIFSGQGQPLATAAYTLRPGDARYSASNLMAGLSAANPAAPNGTDPNPPPPAPALQTPIAVNPAVLRFQARTRSNTNGANTNQPPSAAPAPAPVPAGGAPSASAGPAIPSAALSYLQANPHLSDLFDQKYGPGTSDAVLGR